MKLTLLLFLLFSASALSFLAPHARHRIRKATFLRQQSWQSLVSKNPDASEAISELLEKLEGVPDLAFLFVGQPHAPLFELIIQKAYEKLGPDCRLLSLLAGGVVGEDEELDEPSKPSMSLLAGTLPAQADIEVFDFNELLKAPPDPQSKYWAELIGSNDHSSVILLVDPWSPVESILKGLESCVVAGGISVPTSTRPSIAVDNKPLPQGSAVGVCFRRGLGLQVVVAQGCRPVGPTFIITTSEKNLILELDGKPALKTLEQMANEASIEEQRQISSGLVCGIASDNEEDYLIRQIMGFVPSKGAIAVGGMINTGDRFRFHVRDKDAAKEDLQLMTKRAKTERLFDSNNMGRPVAALQISCVARGRGLFGAPNVDLSNIKELVAGPIGGFYANGEIGPVGIAGFETTNSGTYLHGFTAATVVNPCK